VLFDCLAAHSVEFFLMQYSALQQANTFLLLFTSFKAAFYEF